MKLNLITKLTLTALYMCVSAFAFASSHREAPLISSDPLADNTDLYAFRSPCNPNNVVIIANYKIGRASCRERV